MAQTPLLLFGAFLPDLIDKPLAIVSDLPSRGLSHSILALSILFFLSLTTFPRWRSVILAVGVGAFLHLAEDLITPVIAFWPFLGTWEHFPPSTLVEKISNYYLHFKSPYSLAIEVASYPFFVWFLLKRKDRLRGKPVEDIANR